jgi:hypothetical protein
MVWKLIKNTIQQNIIWTKNTREFGECQNSTNPQKGQYKWYPKLQTHWQFMFYIKSIWKTDPQKNIRNLGSEQTWPTGVQTWQEYCNTLNWPSVYHSQITQNDLYIFVSSLDLSAAFDLVNIDLLIKRLEIVYYYSDFISLINNGYLVGSFMSR